jgi:hypothetical protein
MTTRILGTVAACVLLTQLAVARDPPMLYGVSHIRNDSATQATTYFKWGNGPWKKIVIERGKSISFSYQYDGNSKSSPDLYIRIDVTTSAGVHYVEHIVSRGQSPDDNTPRYGHTFAIRQVKDTDTRYIDAVTTGATVKVIDKRTSKPSGKID